MRMDVLDAPLIVAAPRPLLRPGLFRVPVERASIAPARLEGIDLLRGVVMILMTLDHARIFFGDVHFDPTDLARTTPALFLTRWVTHFCAPVFLFMAGTGAFLWVSRDRTRPQLARFLLTRGLFLVVLEATLVHWSWSFRLVYHPLRCQVIWVIGWSMVALSGLVFLPVWGVLSVGVWLIASSPWNDALLGRLLGESHWARMLLTHGGSLEPGSGVRLAVTYALLPWLGIMAVGYGLGPMRRLERGQRRRRVAVLGAVATVLFIGLRAANGYGSGQPWAPQATGLSTLLSFVNCQKYPPSPPYVLMTLGPALLVLAWLDRPPGAFRQWFMTFGRVPLFYYVAHLPLLHLLAVAHSRFYRAVIVAPVWGDPGELQSWCGKGLPLVYVAWLSMVLLLAPACRWYANFKQGRRCAWVRYL